MIIVVTGCDKTGKTTLSRKLADQLAAEYLHFSKPPVKAFGYFHKALETKTRNNIVVDRWAEGDAVYSEALGHESHLSALELDKLLKEAEDRGLIYIFCWDENEEVKRRFREDKETFVPPEKIEVLQNIFYKEAKRIASQYSFPVFWLNNFTKEVKLL